MLNPNVMVASTKWMRVPAERGPMALVLLYEDNTWEAILTESMFLDFRVWTRLKASDFRFKTRGQAHELADELTSTTTYRSKK